MHNKKFSDDIIHSFQSQYNDWSVTSLFYSALHLINAYLYAHNIPKPANIENDQKLLKKNYPQFIPSSNNCASSANTPDTSWNIQA